MAQKKETVTCLRDARPADYSLRIESFSSFVERKIVRYESSLFESGGYKWRLCLYPSGDKIKTHISLYLAIAETEKLDPRWKVNVQFKMFLYNDNEDQYLTVQDANDKEWRFHEMKKECGFKKLIDLETFNDEDNGYLVDDACLFGVELFVVKDSGNGESLLVIEPPMSSANTVTRTYFHNLDSTEYYSDEFIVGDHKWKLVVYPKGNGSGVGKYLSLYLMLVRDANLPPERKLYVEYKLGIKIYKQNYYEEKEGEPAWFSASCNMHGFDEFKSLGEINYNSDYIERNDALIIRGQIMVMSHVKDLS